MKVSRRHVMAAGAAWTCLSGAAAAEVRAGRLPVKRPRPGQAHVNRGFAASTNHPAATEAARTVRLQGGGVFDMYLAALSTAWVVDPANCSPFGRMQGLYRTGAEYGCLHAATKIRALPGSTIPIPGNIAAWYALREAGQLQLPAAAILAPARRIALNGYRPTEALSVAIESSADDLQGELREIYLDGSNKARVHVRNPGLAELMDVLGRTDTAANFWAELYRRRPGPWAKDELLTNTPHRSRPRALTLRGPDGRAYRLLATGNQETWGAWTLLAAAVIAELKAAGALTSLEISIEAYLLATILVLDRIPFNVGSLTPKASNPSVDIDIEGEGRLIAGRVRELLGASRAELWAALDKTYFPGEGSHTDDTNTNAFAVAAGDDVLSFTTSMGPWFGSKQGWFGAGLAYSYAMKSGRLFAGQTLDVTEMSPLIIERNGRPWLACGAAGSERIFGALTYLIFLKLGLGATGDMADLMTSPRLFPKDGKVRVHHDMPNSVRSHLVSRGFVMDLTDYDLRRHLGIVNLIEQTDAGIFHSGADPSGAGGAL